jgi:urea transport system ATP-binding protein
MTDQGKILEVQDVTVSFDGFTVLNKLDFSMDYGELRFLIGPNGAGKTTLLDIITSKTKADAGQVFFDGHLDVGRLSEHEIVQRGIGRKFQTPTIFSSLTVYENLEAAIGFREGAMRLIRRLSGTHRDRIDEILELVGLQDRAQMRAGLLSHGQKQWLEIGMLLIQEPKLLLLDEPVAGMTRRERNRTGGLVQKIAQQHSVLVVEHDMEFVRQFANNVTVLHTGQVLCEGSMDQVQNDPRVIEVYLGRGRGEERVTATKKARSNGSNAKRYKQPRVLRQRPLAA